MSPRGGSRVAVVAVACGALLAVGAPLSWLLAPAPSAEFGQGRAAAVAAPAPGPAAPAAAETDTAKTTAAETATASARLADLAARAVDPPVEVVLPGGPVEVVPVGVDERALVEVPVDVRQAGWYRFGAAPGDPSGSALLVGHVDSAEQGLGRFAELSALQEGDEVQVRRQGGALLTYDVVAREQWGKAEVPMDRLVAATGDPRLVLLSCAGAFDERTATYSDNIAVTAVPRP